MAHMLAAQARTQSEYALPVQVDVQRQREVLKISTGASAVDELLKGGFETKAGRRAADVWLIHAL